MSKKTVKDRRANMDAIRKNLVENTLRKWQRRFDKLSELYDEYSEDYDHLYGDVGEKMSRHEWMREQWYFRYCTISIAGRVFEKHQRMESETANFLVVNPMTMFERLWNDYQKSHQ